MISNKNININLHDRLNATHLLEGKEGQLLSSFLKEKYIPKDAILAKIGTRIIDDENYVLTPNEKIDLFMVRAYQLPEYCKMLQLWDQPSYEKPTLNTQSIYTKNILWFNENGICDYKSTSFNKEAFLTWVENNFVEGILRKNLISEGEEICLALSGGRDSLALLYLFGKTKDKLPAFKLTGVTVAETAASKNDIIIAKEAMRKFGLEDYTILPLDYVNKTMNFTKGFSSAIEKTLRDEGRGRSITVWHSIMRANVEKFARERNIKKIAFGYQHEDLLASILRCNTLGSLLGESASQFSWGNFTLISPLWTVTKKELTIYLEYVAPKSHTQQGAPTNFDRGDHNRDINYFIADLLSSVYPGIGYSIFESLEQLYKNYHPRTPEYYHCKNCGTTYNDRFSEGQLINANYCETCLYLRENGEIEKLLVVS